MASVIVIGNGPSLLGKNLGEKINQFDVVVRCNNFEIKGFEKDTGTKTDVWAVNTSRSTNPRNCNFFKSVWYKEQPHYKLLQKLNHDSSVLNMCQKIIDPQAFCSELKKGGIITDPGDNPTLGTRAIFMALSIYETVHIAGFDFMIGEKDDRFFKHYYTDKGNWASKAQLDYYDKYFIGGLWNTTKEKLATYKEAVKKNLMVKSDTHQGSKEKNTIEILIKNKKVFLLE